MNRIKIEPKVKKKAKKYGVIKDLDKLIEKLSYNKEHGDKLPRHKWPSNLYKNHKDLLLETNNLWKDEVRHSHPGFRIYYTILKNGGVEIFVLEIDPHTKTDRYKTGVNIFITTEPFIPYDRFFK